MILYNVTTKVSWQIAEQWLSWQQAIHIPEMLRTGLFTEHKIFHLLDQDEEDGPTYAVQFFLDSAEKYEEYVNRYAPVLRQKSIDLWGNQIIAFRSVMQLVN
jgi:ABC-type transport system involved in cytochrome bd biosynthesis fused ATPase/permease subunit